METETSEPSALQPISPQDFSGNAKRLTQRQIAQILQLDAADLPQSKIALQVGFSEATISRVLSEWSDTRDLARKRLEAGAEQLAQTVVRTKDSGVALKALGKLDVVREDTQSGNIQVAVMIGQPGQSLAPPPPILATVSPEIIEVRREVSPVALSAAGLSPTHQTVQGVSPAMPLPVTEANSKAKATPIWGLSPDDVV